MKERGILMSAPMALGALNGSKTQTRRVIKLPHQNPLGQWEALPWGGPNGGRLRDGSTVPAQMVIGHSRTGDIIGYPNGQPGDRLWVREAWRVIEGADSTPPRDLSPAHRIWFEADRLQQPGFGKFRPGMFMPRWASRTLLEITDIRVERLQDISEADAVAEGIRISSAARRSDACYGIYECLMPDGKTHFNDSAYDLYRILWEQINGAGSWATNPWVWVVVFKRLP